MWSVSVCELSVGFRWFFLKVWFQKHLFVCGCMRKRCILYESVKERTAMWHELFTRVRKIKRVGPLWKTCRGSPTIVNDTRLEDFFKITTYIFGLFYIFLKTFFKNWLRLFACYNDGWIKRNLSSFKREILCVKMYYFRQKIYPF